MHGWLCPIKALWALLKYHNSNDVLLIKELLLIFNLFFVIFLWGFTPSPSKGIAFAIQTLCIKKIEVILQ